MAQWVSWYELAWKDWKMHKQFFLSDNWLENYAIPEYKNLKPLICPKFEAKCKARLETICELKRFSYVKLDISTLF